MYGGYKKDIDPEYLKYLESQGRLDDVLNMGGLGLNVAGTVAQGFGAYQAWKEQEAAREEEQRRYQEDQRISAQERRKRDNQQRLENQFRYGSYAREGEQSRRGPYAGYAARVGL